MAALSLPADASWARYSLLLGVSAIAAYVVKWAIFDITSPLNKFPGPFIARWTNLWRFFAVRRGDYHLTVERLHEKYGPVVRLGPNILDLDFPELITTIYGTDNKYLKTDFYNSNSVLVKGEIVPNMFSLTDPQAHSRMKKPVAKHYSLPSVLSIEPLVDRAISELCQHLEERFVKKNEECDLGAYISYCVWDMIGIVTFSRKFGYMEQGRDFDKSLSIAHKSLDYFAAVGQLPFLDAWLDKNPVVHLGAQDFTNISKAAVGRMFARIAGRDHNFDPKCPDYLQRFLSSKEAHPDVVHDGTVINYLFINLIAGTDTTALTIRAVMYLLMKHPDAYRKLKEEVRGADFGDVAQFNAARSLPYLEACIRESMRMHPAIAMILERYVPAAGLMLPTEQLVPAGTKVGINPYVIGRSPVVFGMDAHKFRPERWLQQEEESDAAFEERLKQYNNADLTFGAGSRMCLGRHLGTLNVYKMVATLLSKFDVELTDQGKEWVVTNGFFLRQKDVICKVRSSES